jgi:hypothetical protein
LRFKAVGAFDCYHQPPKHWHDGDVYPIQNTVVSGEMAVTKAQSEMLLKDFPENFFPVP